MSAPEFSPDNTWICQLFINGFGKKTAFTFVNFPSLFAPTGATACTYDLALYDADGAEVGTHMVEVPVNGTAEVHPAELFGARTPELGLLAASLRQDPVNPAYAHLGQLRPFFYALYHDADMGSVAVVHPQTALASKLPPDSRWRSNHLIEPARIDYVEVFQVNPIAVQRETLVWMADLADDVLVSSPASMAPRSVRRIEWPASAFAGAAFAKLACEGNTALNAKPLLFQYSGGSFHAAHS